MANVCSSDTSIIYIASSYEYEPMMVIVASMFESVFRCPIFIINVPLLTNIDVWMVVLSIYLLIIEAAVGRELLYWVWAFLAKFISNDFPFKFQWTLC